MIRRDVDYETYMDVACSRPGVPGFEKHRWTGRAYEDSKGRRCISIYNTADGYEMDWEPVKLEEARNIHAFLTDVIPWLEAAENGD